MRSARFSDEMEPASDNTEFRRVLARQQARLEHQLKWLLTDGGSDGPSAVEAFAAFADHLRCRIDVAHRIVYQAFEEEAGLQHEGPTQRLRREHREIERRLDLVSKRFAAGATLPDVRSDLDALAALLGEHFRLEELILNGISGRLNSYPALADAARELALNTGQQ